MLVFDLALLDCNWPCRHKAMWGLVQPLSLTVVVNYFMIMATLPGIFASLSNYVVMETGIL